MKPIRTINQLLILILFIMVPAISPVCAQSTSLNEYQIKAAMIFNMAKFTDWPSESIPATSEHFSICIYGRGPLRDAVEELQGKPIRGKILSVRRVGHPMDVTNCQILLNESERRHTVSLIEKTKTYPVLTVSDAPGFAKIGGIVGFVMREGKVRFEINPAAAQRHRIRISSRLLQLSLIVHEEL